jgi:hypothetical protein
VKKSTKEKCIKTILDFLKEEVTKIENSKIRAFIFVIYFSYLGINAIFDPYHFISSILFIIFVFFIIGKIAIRLIYWSYYNSRYRKISKNTLLDTFIDDGRRGEFFTFRELEKLNKKNNILLNLYIPKVDGTFSEIDLLIINKTGIYIFESKNISGWVFGSEKDEYWTIMFKKDKKFKMYNPVLQNSYHIKYLKEFLIEEGLDCNCFKSYVVLSKRCKIQKMNIYSNNIKVLNRDNLDLILEEDMKKSKEFLTEEQIKKLYIRLKKCMKNDENFKEAHIQKIKEKYLI